MSGSGILLVNLGTPEAPGRSAVARFLDTFLSDPRVVDLPRWWWLPLLRLVIIPLRSRRVAAAYREIWMDDGSPLLVYSRGLADCVQRLLGDRAGVRLAMRYGEPSVASQLADLRDGGADSLIVLPLYPQYSVTTTESVFDAVAEALQQLQWSPERVDIRQYHDNPGWVHSIATSVRQFQARHGRAEKLLFSMHGIPQRLVDAGDPYERHCRESFQAVASVLKQEEDCILAYQSRVGREPWLQPYTDEVIRDLAKSGVRHLQVISPGFATDCLETLEEIAIGYRDLFLREGGERFEYIPALNESGEHAGVLASICDRILTRQARPDEEAPSA